MPSFVSSLREQIKGFFIILFMYRLRCFGLDILWKGRKKNCAMLYIWEICRCVEEWIEKIYPEMPREKSSHYKLNEFFKFSRLQLEIPFHSLFSHHSFEGTTTFWASKCNLIKCAIFCLCIVIFFVHAFSFSAFHYSAIKNLFHMYVAL